MNIQNIRIPTEEDFSKLSKINLTLIQEDKNLFGVQYVADYIDGSIRVVRVHPRHVRVKIYKDDPLIYEFIHLGNKSMLESLIRVSEKTERYEKFNKLFQNRSVGISMRDVKREGNVITDFKLDSISSVIEYRVPNEWGEVFMPGCFDKSIKEKQGDK